MPALFADTGTMWIFMNECKNQLEWTKIDQWAAHSTMAIS